MERRIGTIGTVMLVACMIWIAWFADDEPRTEDPSPLSMVPALIMFCVGVLMVAYSLMREVLRPRGRNGHE